MKFLLVLSNLRLETPLNLEQISKNKNFQGLWITCPSASVRKNLTSWKMNIRSGLRSRHLEPQNPQLSNSGARMLRRLSKFGSTKSHSKHLQEKNHALWRSIYSQKNVSQRWSRGESRLANTTIPSKAAETAQWSYRLTKSLSLGTTMTETSSRVINAQSRISSA